MDKKSKMSRNTIAWIIIVKDGDEIKGPSGTNLGGIVPGHADLLSLSSWFSFHAISQLHNLLQCLADQSRIMGRNYRTYTEKKPGGKGNRTVDTCRKIGSLLLIVPKSNKSY